MTQTQTATETAAATRILDWGTCESCHRDRADCQFENDCPGNTDAADFAFRELMARAKARSSRDRNAPRGGRRLY